MTRLNQIFRSIAGMLSAFRSAVAVTAAVESGHKPAPRHLARLGIDAAAFAAIGRG